VNSDYDLANQQLDNVIMFINSKFRDWCCFIRVLPCSCLCCGCHWNLSWYCVLNIFHI